MSFDWEGADPSSKMLYETIAILFRRDLRLLTFLFDPKSPRLKRRAGILREESWRLSEDEQLFVRVALDIWSGSGHVQLWEMTESWSGEEWKLFCLATANLPAKPSAGTDQGWPP
ncbi:MAG: hypothetical protein C5B49_11955 [Bdellovibrio sp.]|nr:MAG: hypothetical protein C5B49_11955 [Bdellovibrio sp.]